MYWIYDDVFLLLLFFFNLLTFFRIENVVKIGVQSLYKSEISSICYPQHAYGLSIEL